MEPSEEDIEGQTISTLFWENSLDPEWENFDTFFISRNGIEIIFNAYSVSSYAFGVQIIPIPYENLIPVLKKPDSLTSLMNKLQ